MKIALLILGFLISTNVLGQKLYYANSLYTSDSFNVEVKDAIINLKQDYFKCRIEIINKTNNHIVYKSSESILSINDIDFSCNNLPDMFIPAKESKVSRTIQIDNVSDKISSSDLSKSCQFAVKGIYKKKKIIAIKSDSLVFGNDPAEYLYGGLNVKSGSYVKKTREAWQEFTLTNLGNTTVIADLSKVKIRTGEYVDVPSDKKDIYYLKPTKSIDIKIRPSIPKKIADMQSALIHILWEDSFYEIIFNESYIPDIDIPLNLEKVKD